ncbi:MAG: family 16 glycosylhydrolase [Caldilinea sp.]|nr:family 16 glycosylhydrolase [Caldilineaceae bacterium]MCB9119011.1 family 16 glycosylhydrolase [Caldilineaceae bacterium]MCB9126115.1 family 16 glycosylhydrolase [Caldilineaceae bacterium]MCW5841495.1 family 16 glycosylhydrolase [Caldilinea sp.]
MKSKRLIPNLTLIVALLVQLVGIPLFPAAAQAQSTPLSVVDNFEAPLAYGVAPDNIQVGFFAAQDGNSGPTTLARSTTPPAPVPGAADGNNVLQMDFATAVWAVVIHGFENADATQWVSQDWSAYEGLSFWLYGQGAGASLFIDVIDNRNDPAQPRDDAERYSITFADDTAGWKLVQIPFANFARKDIGNGAPNDGFTLTSVHGWAFGTTTPGAATYYIDDVSVYGTAPVRPLTVGFGAATVNVKEGRTANVVVKLSKPAETEVSVNYNTADGTAVANRNYVPAAGTLTFAPGVTQQTFQVETLGNGKWQGGKSVLLQLSNPVNINLGTPAIAGLNIQEVDPYDPNLLDDFEMAPYMFSLHRDGKRDDDGGRDKDSDDAVSAAGADGRSPKAALTSLEIPADSPLALPNQGAFERVLSVDRSGKGQSEIEFGRRFALGQNWSGTQGLNFWYYGNNTGRKVKVTLLDNQAPDPGPAGWKLVWRDEFNARAGKAPDQSVWGYEIGDGTVNGIPGWGNDELEYYTNSTENAATDGKGNLAITVKEADGSLTCYYGPCKYTSARLLTKDKFEVAYGRVEARVKVPRGAGLWPAFWSLGTDIDRVGWPQTGEIDIMENVGRQPNQVFGTIHGPGYSGGQSFGGIYDLPNPVADDYHTFAVEWQPGEIRWYIDGILYHTAKPESVAPNQWVFDHPFFLLLNVAVGGNFGGPVGPDTVFPQTMLVDYVRVYQAQDTAERFEAQFRDDFSGWKRVSVPFSSFKRSDDQPKGAPRDGLTLSSVWGYGFQIPGGYRGQQILLDQVRVQPNCAYDVTVTNTADAGAGSLRQALADVCFAGTIGFAPALAGQTIVLSSELTIAKPVTINGAGAPGLTISGGGAVRAFVVNAFIPATLRNLTVSNGYGWELAGGILNNGTLTLDRVTVANNNVTTSGVDFWKGGAGIYNGDGSTLTLVDSTVRDNRAEGGAGGGVYAFFNAAVDIVRSTISGNVATDVGGGIRSLGDFTIVNSTISGNTSTGWHGGAIFHTEGTMEIANSTITNNAGPEWAPSAIFLGEWGPLVPVLKLTNTIVAGNRWYACERFAAPNPNILISGGNNLIQDASCNPVASDLILADAGLAALADNGGPTWTHALVDGSPAIDAANATACPATDQRGAPRPVGAGCDIGAFEAGGVPAVTAAGVGALQNPLYLPAIQR